MGSFLVKILSGLLLNSSSTILALGSTNPWEVRSKVRPLLVTASNSSLNPLAQSSYLASASRTLEAINAALVAATLVALVALAARARFA